MSNSHLQSSTPDADELERLQALAEQIASQAGMFLADGLAVARTDVETKSSTTDMVSEMDRGAEDLIVGLIRQNRAGDGLLGEEGSSEEGQSGFRWVIDPLDGTTNYLYNHPLWSVSIGIEYHGNPVVGVVAAPMLNALFSAREGSPATRNGVPIVVGTCESPQLALIGTGFAYSADIRAQQGGLVHRLLPLVRDLRRGGSAALDLAFVATGALDAYYEWGLNPWDSCAGTVIVRSAGGVVSSNVAGSEPSKRLTLATNAKLHSWLLNEVTAIESPFPA